MDDQHLFSSIKGRLNNTEEASVQRWRGASPENERRYRELAEILVAAGSAEEPLESTPPSALWLIHRAESRAASLASPTEGASQIAARRSSGPGHRVRWGVAVAAVLVLSFAVGRGVDSSLPAKDQIEIEEFASGSVEAATVTLRDGSVVRLAPRSRLRVTSGRARDVALWGRAFFAVAKDPDRPFRISTAAGDVEVLGTRFEIESRDEALHIAVIEGRVALSVRGNRNEVPAGLMRRVIAGVTLPAEPIPDDHAIADWAGTFLAFQDTPLREAAREIGRLYGISVEILDDALAAQTITAWFVDQPLDQVLAILCMVAQAECIGAAGDDTIILRPETRPRSDASTEP
jgi:transmembrane sensor